MKLLSISVLNYGHWPTDEIITIKEPASATEKQQLGDRQVMAECLAVSRELFMADSA